MERNKIIAIAVLALGIVGWRMGAMQREQQAVQECPQERMVRFAAANPTNIILRTNDGWCFEISKDDAGDFETIHDANLMQSEGHREIIPLRHIASNEFRQLYNDLPFARAVRNSPLRIDETVVQRAERSAQALPAVDYVYSADGLRQAIARLRGADYLGTVELKERYARIITGMLLSDKAMGLLRNQDAAYMALLAGLPEHLRLIIVKYMPSTVWVEEFMIQHGGVVKSVAISADGTRVVTGSEDRTAKIQERNRAGTWQEVQLIKHNSWVDSVAISADGNRVVTGSEDKTAQILERNAGVWQAVRVIPHADSVRSVAVSADGNRVVTGSDDNTAKILELNAAGAWQQVQVIQHGGWVVSVAISADGNRVVTGSGDNRAKIQERNRAGTWQGVQLIKHNAGIYSVAISADGNRVVTGSEDSTAKILERNGAGAWEQVHVVPHAGAVRSVAISADGNRVVTGSDDKTARILERDGAGTWQQVHVVPHAGAVRSVAISADGNRVVIGSDDKTARILERNGASAWEQVRVIQYGRWVNLVAISADGNRVLTGSLDKTAKIVSEVSGSLPGLSDFESRLFVKLLDWSREKKQKISKTGWVGEMLRALTWEDINPAYQRMLQ